MTDLDLKAEAVAEGYLQLMFPEAGSVAIAAAAVSQDEQAVGGRIMCGASLSPPSGYGIDGELGSVAAGTDAYKTFITQGIIDAVGDREALRIGRKIMIEDLHRLTTPSSPRLMKRSDQLTALGIDTDRGHSFGCIVS